MIFKSYILEQKIDDIDKYKIVLFYGENEGLKKDFKNKIKNYYSKNELLNFSQDDINKNRNLLLSEVSNKSLFNEKKVIFIDQSSDKILEILEDLVQIIENEKIYVFCNALEKKSKLRNYFEKSQDCAIVACYQDNEITIKKIISSQLSSFKGLTPHLINQILLSCGLDRDKVNNEIEKIKICFKEKIIDPTKIEELLNIATNEDFNKLKDEALNGNKINTNRLLANTYFGTEYSSYYINIINQRLNKLIEIQNLKQDKTDNIEELISNLKPPVFWKDKPFLISQTSKWDMNKLQTILEKTYSTELEIKSNSAVRKDLLIKNLILEICTTANSV